jgi:hypothetical protein
MAMRKCAFPDADAARRVLSRLYARNIVHVRARTVSLLAGLVLLGGAPGSSWAQTSTRSPSPKELWNAYPLDPGGTALNLNQALPPVEANAAPSPSGSDDDGGFPAGIAIALAAAAFTAGLALGRGRRRETQTETAMAVRPEPSAGNASPAASERRFVWRDYPPPSRPAPPPPPPPGVAATSVAVAPQPGRGGRQ